VNKSLTSGPKSPVSPVFSGARPEHRVRWLCHRAGVERGRAQGSDRPFPLAADGASGSAGWGRTFADIVTNALSVTVLVVTGLIVGFSFHASFLNILAGVGLLLLFGYAFSWVFALVGLLVSSPEAANSFGFIAIFPLTFISSAFVPVSSMPSVLRAFANVNPFTVTVDAMRSLWIGAPAGNNVWGAFVWAIVILVVFSPLAVSRYRRAAGR
jgi:ABC-type multidrug transport system permease subunit